MSDDLCLSINHADSGGKSYPDVFARLVNDGISAVSYVSPRRCRGSVVVGRNQGASCYHMFMIQPRPLDLQSY